MSEALDLPSLQTIAAFDAFLAEQLDDGAWELVGGEIVAMTNPSQAHEEIAGNLAAAFRAVLSPDRHCRVAAGGLRVQASDDKRGIYSPRPDVMVWCGPMRAEQHHVSTPMIIVEVLSPSSMDHDRSTKLRFYKTALPTLRHIALVYQDQMRVELYSRTGHGWELVTLIHPDDRAIFASLMLEVKLADIYAGVEPAG